MPLNLAQIRSREFGGKNSGGYLQLGYSIATSSRVEEVAARMRNVRKSSLDKAEVGLGLEHSN